MAAPAISAPHPPKPPASHRCLTHSFKKANSVAFFRILKTLHPHNREQPVHNTSISFGAKDCKTCCAPSCAQPIVWRPGLRPPPHSLLQIHAPHPPCEMAIWASKPFWSSQHALLGLDLLDSWSCTASLPCLNSSLWLLVVSVVSLEVALLEHVRRT